MFSRSALVVFGVAVIEFFVFIFLARIFGGLLVALVTILFSVGGLYYLARFAPKVLRRGFRQLLNTAGEVDAEEAGDQAGRIMAGLFLTTPGILTGVCGLLLLVKPVRKLFSPILGVQVVRLVPTGPIRAINASGRRQRGNVIDVDVVGPDGQDGASPTQKPKKFPQLPHKRL